MFNKAGVSVVADIRKNISIFILYYLVDEIGYTFNVYNIYCIYAVPIYWHGVYVFVGFFAAEKAFINRKDCSEMLSAIARLDLHSRWILTNACRSMHLLLYAKNSVAFCYAVFGYTNSMIAISDASPRRSPRR